MDGEVQRMQSNWRWGFHVAVFLLLLFLGYPYFRDVPRPYGVLDMGMLPFHEAGHFVFGVLGEFMGVLGGSLVQVLMPLGFGLYFAFVRRDWFAGLACLFWLFQNLVNISIYMADSRKMLLPLFGGSDDVIHDWNFLFGRMHKLNQADSIAATVAALGRLGMAASYAAMAGWLFVTRPGAAEKAGTLNPVR